MAQRTQRMVSDSLDSDDEPKATAQPQQSVESSTASNPVHRRASSKRWYSDSDEEPQMPSTRTLAEPKVSLTAEDVPPPMVAKPAPVAEVVPVPTKAPPPPSLNLHNIEDPKRKMSGIQKLVQKTKILSPFRSSAKKALENPPTPTTAPPPPPPPVDTPSTSSTASQVRRQSRRRHSIDEAVSSPRHTGASLAATHEDDADDPFKGSIGMLSPGRVQLGGAAPGPPGSGVLLEGWLRQKQRRGIRGLKKWNSRYFVLHAKVLELRYYSDVVRRPGSAEPTVAVSSGWGPIPLGEIGSIVLRSIQRISKPSHPKYKGASILLCRLTHGRTGCRFDITCRSLVPDPDDDASSDDEHKKDASQQPPTPMIKTTPKASRVYSLIADSPQTTVLWVNTIDSLLTRSVNSPRPDISTPRAPQPLKTLAQLNQSRQKLTSHEPLAGSGTSSGGLTPRPNEWMVWALPDDVVPKPVVYAVEYIFESTPGIETESFYELDAPPAQLKVVLTRLNQCAVERRKPTRNEWEDVFDVVSAAGVVKLWLQQLEGPVIPVEMFPEFQHVMEEAAVAPFELLRNLKALLATLPRKPFKILGFLVFHWNDVTVYASKNKLTAPVLAARFSELVLRPRVPSEKASRAAQLLLEHLITHADALIDEKESEILDA
ncbi:hypothetical protein ACHHYP_02884 [Achlya hypogyna]|uniref:Rho GTPase-activating protein n=1 Tax=Achlya hypogyna TaxID=1202772 RepID=A0A1V9ZS97_ACHHY|nr:hypothetical protein ACHHYP_02884 [Achlya hypogyna]